MREFSTEMCTRKNTSPVGRVFFPYVTCKNLTRNCTVDLTKDFDTAYEISNKNHLKPNIFD